MIPIVLDPNRTSLALVGRGEVARRRLDALLAGGADAIAVFSDAPSPELAELAAHRLRRSLPGAGELAGFRAVWIADLPLAEAAPTGRSGPERGRCWSTSRTSRTGAISTIRRSCGAATCC